MTHSLFLSVLFVAGLSAQGDPVPAPPTAQKPAALQVEVPTFPNTNCPIMGKKVSMPLFVDTEVGRFYVCCKPCIKKILANVPAAQKTGYPTTKEVGNKVCPVSGEPIGDHAVAVTLQGNSFSVCCAACVEEARRDSQITLTKLLREGIVDVGNATCPVTGEPVATNAFVLIGKSLVRLSSPKVVETVEKDPAAVLQKATEFSKRQPPKAKHVHTPKEPPAAKSGEGK